MSQQISADFVEGLSLIDSHCHLHDLDFFTEDQQAEMYARATAQSIGIICVGTDVRSSYQAVDFATRHRNTWSLVGIHPHDAQYGGVESIEEILERRLPKVIGIGEIGLDYFYDNSDRATQVHVLRKQLKLARTFNKPVSFHVRDEKGHSGAVWNDFWPIFDEFPVRGVLHSFTDTQSNLEKGLERGLYIGLNGISTFTRDNMQQKLYKNIPMDRILFETDAPFLTPQPFRGKINEPIYVKLVVEFWANKRGLTPDELARCATANVCNLFGL